MKTHKKPKQNNQNRKLIYTEITQRCWNLKTKLYFNLSNMFALSHYMVIWAVTFALIIKLMVYTPGAFRLRNTKERPRRLYVLLKKTH